MESVTGFGVNVKTPLQPDVWAVKSPISKTPYITHTKMPIDVTHTQCAIYRGRILLHASLSHTTTYNICVHPATCLSTYKILKSNTWFCANGLAVYSFATHNFEALIVCRHRQLLQLPAAIGRVVHVAENSASRPRESQPQLLAGPAHSWRMPAGGREGQLRVPLGLATDVRVDRATQLWARSTREARVARPLIQRCLFAPLSAASLRSGAQRGRV